MKKGKGSAELVSAESPALAARSQSATYGCPSPADIHNTHVDVCSLVTKTSTSLPPKPAKRAPMSELRPGAVGTAQCSAQPAYARPCSPALQEKKENKGDAFATESRSSGQAGRGASKKPDLHALGDQCRPRPRAGDSQPRGKDLFF